MEVKNGIIFGGVLLTAILIYKNSERRAAENNDAVSDDLSDHDARIALEFYQIMAPTNITGVGWTTQVYKSDFEKAALLLNTCLKVTDFNATKEKFRQLCDGTYTLSNALASSLRTDFYNSALDLAAAKKVITTKACKVTIGEKRGNTIESNRIDVDAGTLVGALKETYSDSYLCYNGFRGIDNFFSEDEMITYLATGNSSDVKLV